MRISILAPIATSLYARVVTSLLARESGIEINLIVVRSPWSWRRVRSEWRRDGARLIRKVAQKMVLQDSRFDGGAADTLLALARRTELAGRSLHDVGAPCGARVATVDDHNSPRSLSLLAEARPDVIVFTGGGLLRKPLLDLARVGVLNCHMGILPWYRGMDVVEWTALEGALAEPGIGVTVHFMDQGVDTGAILTRRRTELLPGDDFATIRRRMERDMAVEMVQCVKALRDGTVMPQPQQLVDGRQYFVMHPILMDRARRNLAAYLETATGAQRGAKVGTPVGVECVP